MKFLNNYKKIQESALKNKKISDLKQSFDIIYWDQIEQVPFNFKVGGGDDESKSKVVRHMTSIPSTNSSPKPPYNIYKKPGKFIV